MIVVDRIAAKAVLVGDQRLGARVRGWAIAEHHTTPPFTTTPMPGQMGTKKEPRQPATRLSSQHDAPRETEALSSIHKDSPQPSASRQYRALIGAASGRA